MGARGPPSQLFNRPKAKSRLRGDDERTVKSTNPPAPASKVIFSPATALRLSSSLQPRPWRSIASGTVPQSCTSQGRTAPGRQSEPAGEGAPRCGKSRTRAEEGQGLPGQNGYTKGETALASPSPAFGSPGSRGTRPVRSQASARFPCRRRRRALLLLLQPPERRRGSSGGGGARAPRLLRPSSHGRVHCGTEGKGTGTTARPGDERAGARRGSARGEGAAPRSRVPRIPADPLSALRTEGKQKRRLTKSPLALFLPLRLFQAGLSKKDGTESSQQAWNSSDVLPCGDLPPPRSDLLFLDITSFWPKKTPPSPQISQRPTGFWAL